MGELVLLRLIPIAGVLLTFASLFLWPILSPAGPLIAIAAILAVLVLSLGPLILLYRLLAKGARERLDEREASESGPRDGQGL